MSALVSADASVVMYTVGQKGSVRCPKSTKHKFDVGFVVSRCSYCGVGLGIGSNP